MEQTQEGTTTPCNVNSFLGSIAIQKNIPICKGAVAGYVELLAMMESGDSFLTESKNISFSTLSKAAGLMGGSSTVVKLPMGYVRVHFNKTA